MDPEICLVGTIIDDSAGSMSQASSGSTIGVFVTFTGGWFDGYTFSIATTTVVRNASSFGRTESGSTRVYEASKWFRPIRASLSSDDHGNEESENEELFHW
eukprot:TRINITY_DN1190_c0_g1_i1.p2 TRINITY_DN1190_c0_g1~~TRINITY_DN1190_c0_g1_i1.p2  ORF type:complete len:101 (+),score=12.41 TRINITY_DN1190_c0_g1_i1:108-410(+)